MISFDEYIRKLDERLKKYIPPKGEWNPPEQAVYGVKDLYNVPLEKAKRLQFKAVKFQFKRHYEENKFYRKLCENQNVNLNDIRSYDDLKKRVPLLPDPEKMIVKRIMSELKGEDPRHRLFVLHKKREFERD